MCICDSDGVHIQVLFVEMTSNHKVSFVCKMCYTLVNCIRLGVCNTKYSSRNQQIHSLLKDGDTFTGVFVYVFT